MDYVCTNIDLLPVWHRLTEYCKKYEPFMRIKRDDIGYYRLETNSKKPFIATCVQKKHVGVYSVVMYRQPHLIPKELEQFRIGKSCIGFLKIEDEIKHVPKLIENIFDYYAQNEGIR